MDFASWQLMQALSALLRVAILLALLSSKASAIFPGAAIEDIILFSLFCGFKNTNGPRVRDSVSAKEHLYPTINSIAREAPTKTHVIFNIVFLYAFIIIS